MNKQQQPPRKPDAGLGKVIDMFNARRSSREAFERLAGELESDMEQGRIKPDLTIEIYIMPDNRRALRIMGDIARVDIQSEILNIAMQLGVRL